MPVIPSFTGFAATPNLATAYLGGARIAQSDRQQAAQIQLQRERMSQEAALTRERLAAQQVQNEMELQAKRDILERELLQKQHEAEIAKSYRETQLNISRGHLDVAEANAKRQLGEAAQGLAAQQAYERRRSDLYEQLKSKYPNDDAKAQREAANLAMMQVGFGSPGFAGAINEPAARAPRMVSAVVGQDLMQRPTRERMTAEEFQRVLPTLPPELQTNTVNSAISNMLRPLEIPAGVTSTGTTPTPKARMAARANELSRQHPDWSRDQVIKAVRDEFK